MENKNKETKLVFNYGVTRKLLAAGCTIVDIKPDRTNEETGKERTNIIIEYMDGQNETGFT